MYFELPHLGIIDGIKTLINLTIHLTILKLDTLDSIQSHLKDNYIGTQ